jgi:hypothetical protein
MKKMFLLVVPLALLALAQPAKPDSFVAPPPGGDWKPTPTWTRIGGGSGRQAPGTVSGRADQARIPVNATVNGQGPVSLDSLTVNGTVQGASSTTDLSFDVDKDIDVGATGRVGGGPSATGKNGVRLVSKNGVVNINGNVWSNNKPLVVGGRDGVNVNGNAEAKGSNANVYSTEGSVKVSGTGMVLADKQVDINSGPGKPTQIDGLVKSSKGDVVINGGAKPQPPQPNPPGNVIVGAAAFVLAPNGEVVIYADTLIVEGTIQGKTVQKHCKTVIIRGSGSITGKGSEIDYAKEQKSEEHPPEKPAEESKKQFSIGPENSYFDYSAYAIRGGESVQVVGGPGSTIDLTGNPAGWPVIECPGPIRLNADFILLDPGVLIESICGPGPVLIGPSIGFPKVATYPLWPNEAYAGMPLEVFFSVQNLGNVPDTIEITASDSLGWGVVPSISIVALDGISAFDTTIVITCPVPPWAIPEVDTNSIRLRVRSLFDPTVEYEEDVLVPVRAMSDLMDATVAPYQVVSPHGGGEASIIWWVENSGALPLGLELFVEDERGWLFAPSFTAMPLDAGAESFVSTAAFVPPTEPDGTVNHVVARVQDVTGMVVYADTVEVVVGSLTGVGDGEPPLAGGLRHGSRPNPFNPMVEIWFEMPARGEAQVEILDQRGRIVRTVFASTCEAGRRICTWDGKNAQGTAAGSGVYMYRVRAAGLSATGKVTLTR